MVQPCGNKCAKGARAAAVAGHSKEHMKLISQSALVAGPAEARGPANPRHVCQCEWEAWSNPGENAPP